MTRAEAAELVTVIVAAYPNFDKFKNPQEVRNYVELLTIMFAAEPGGAVGLAVKKHIATSKWPPSIAEIRELMLETQHPEIIPPDLAWAAVSDLMFTFKRFQWEEVKKRLPALVARCVEIIGWQQLCDMHHADESGKHAGIDRVAFMKQYEPMYGRAKREAMTPPQVAVKITGEQAALPDTSYRLIESAEAGRRMKELEIEEERAARKRAMELALAQENEERQARIQRHREMKARGEIPKPGTAAGVAFNAMQSMIEREGENNAKG